MYYLGSSAFLRQCAGTTLGCGRAVASVADRTPYFSAPRTWARTTCNQWYSFRANGKCVEAQRLEVSDTRNYIEGNPGLFDGLGVRHSDGRNCAGSGETAVRITSGRDCAADGSDGVALGTPTAGDLPGSDLPVPPVPPTTPPPSTPTPKPDPTPGTGGTCKYSCADYNYEPGDCSGGYYCQYADSCLVYDATCK